MSSASSEDPQVLVLAAEPHVVDLPDEVAASVAAPADVDDGALFDATAFVVRDHDGLDRVRAHGVTGPVVAFVTDPTGDVATAPEVDAVSTTTADLAATLRWLLASEPARDAPSRRPSRVERLNAGATRLASVRSIEEAHQAIVAVADEVFPTLHCLVGVRDGEWVEPAIASSSNDEITYDALLSLPVGDETVVQLATDDPDGFDGEDRRLADLFASHIEETLGRIRVDEALRTELDRLLALFSNVPDPAIAYDYVDGDPVIHRVNDAFEETFGYDAATVVGESVDDYIVPADEAAVEEAEELNQRLQRGENVRREVTRRTVDGARHFILHVIPIRLDAENVSGYAIYTDVTERREREAALRRQNERLDEFASIVSHDLRNPLSVAEGYVDLALESDDPAHLEKAANALDRMDELVGDLLALARQGRAVGDAESVSLAALARDAWASVDTEDAELVVEGDVTLEANPTRTLELLENVFRNSVEHGRSRDGDAVSRDDENSEPKFSNHSTDSRARSDDGVERGSTGDGTPPGDGVDRDPPSNGPLTVRVGEASFRRDGDPTAATGFFVEDDGRGFPDGAADRVFESGFTTGEEGTGLGLAISERIAEAHGWEVRALTGENGGARFEFRTE